MGTGRARRICGSATGWDQRRALSCSEKVWPTAKVNCPPPSALVITRAKAAVPVGGAVAGAAVGGAVAGAAVGDAVGGAVGGAAGADRPGPQKGQHGTQQQTADEVVHLGLWLWLHALERRFQTVIVEPPTVDETVEILKGLRSKYEEHHKVTIPDSTLVCRREDVGALHHR